jgi:hypothetical protein
MGAFFRTAVARVACASASASGERGPAERNHGEERPVEGIGGEKGGYSGTHFSVAAGSVGLRKLGGYAWR